MVVCVGEAAGHSGAGFTTHHHGSGRLGSRGLGGGQMYEIPQHQAHEHQHDDEDPVGAGMVHD